MYKNFYSYNKLMRIIKKAIVYSFCLINSAFLLASFIPIQDKAKLTLISPVIQAAVSANTTNDQIKTDNNKSEEDNKQYNILLLGLDARRGDGRPRCDAIHIFSFSPSEEFLTITSIPRGTRINLANVATQSAYLSNNCHINGIEDTISKIEEISGVNVDAYLTVGFSQVLGILRAMNLPTTPTLQYLRNRRYGIGDYQRSHNQANFLKDMLTSHFGHFYNLPNNFREFLFKNFDGNLDFNTANYLVEAIFKKNIYLNPENIILITKPERSKYVNELHIDLSENDLEKERNDIEFITYQRDLENYLNNLISGSEQEINSGFSNRAYQKLIIPFQQKLWLQIEDKTIREEIHYNFLKVILLTTTDKTIKETLVRDYINEAKILNNNDYLEKAKELAKI